MTTILTTAAAALTVKTLYSVEMSQAWSQHSFHQNASYSEVRTVERDVSFLHVTPYRIGLRPGGRVPGTSPLPRHAESRVDIRARRTATRRFSRFWGHGRRYWRMDSGVLHRMPVRI